MPRPRGYTLIETLVVIIIVGVLAAFVAPVLTSAIGSYDTTSRNVEVLTKARYSMERMAREIRQTRRDPANSAQYDIATMTASELQFCKADDTRVRLLFDDPSDTLELAYTSGFAGTCTAAAAATEILTDSVSGFSFSYCMADGTTCLGVDKTNVVFVDITLTLTGSGTAAYTNVTRVDLRAP